MKEMNKKNFGFTLVELMISISIIAILSVVLSISFSKAQKSGRDQRRIEDLKAIQSAAEQMVMLSGTYPTSSNSYVSGRTWQIPNQTVLQSYPQDPKNSGGYVYRTVGTISSSSYCVCALMEDSKNANADISSNVCDFTNKSGYFCVKNQQ